MKKLVIAALAASFLFLQGCMGAAPLDDQPGVKEKPIANSYSTANSIDDAAIESNINKLILTDQRFTHGVIVTTVLNGIVLLTGEVDSEEQKSHASKLANGSQGVNLVVNKIELLGKTTPINRANDSLITAEIEAKLIRDKIVDPSNIKVVTERGVVYLLAIITTRTQGDAIVSLTKQVRGVVRIVKLFML